MAGTVRTLWRGNKLASGDWRCRVLLKGWLDARGRNRVLASADVLLRAIAGMLADAGLAKTAD